MQKNCTLCEKDKNHCEKYSFLFYNFLWKKMKDKSLKKIILESIRIIFGIRIIEIGD